jgi:hypothetical protein
MRRFRVQAKVKAIPSSFTGRKINLTPGEWYYVEISVIPKKGPCGKTKKLETYISIIRNGWLSPLV